MKNITEILLKHNQTEITKLIAKPARHFNEINIYPQFCFVLSESCLHEFDN